jgi:hypothetical protein
MFRGLFNRSSDNNKGVGIYKLEGTQLVELDQQPGNGSINSIINKLGYELTQIHTVHTFDSTAISCIGVKVFTQEVVFVLAEDENSNLNLKEVKQELKKVDWGFEYSSHTIEEILSNGIDAQNLSFKYLNSIINLKEESNSVFLAPSLELYLNFKSGILVSFVSSEWTSAASKWLIDANENMFNNMLEEATKYHSNKIEAMEEVNLQCEAIQGIPNATRNEFIPLHLKQTGNINFYNLFAAH